MQSQVGMKFWKIYRRDCMKKVLIHFEDAEHKQLMKKKKEYGLNWHDFVMLLTKLKDKK